MQDFKHKSSFVYAECTYSRPANYYCMASESSVATIPEQDRAVISPALLRAMDFTVLFNILTSPTYTSEMCCIIALDIVVVSPLKKRNWN